MLRVRRARSPKLLPVCGFQWRRLKPLCLSSAKTKIRGTPLLNQVYIIGLRYNLYALMQRMGQFRMEVAAEAVSWQNPLFLITMVIFGSEDQRLHVVGIRAGKSSVDVLYGRENILFAAHCRRSFFFWLRRPRLARCQR